RAAFLPAAAPGGFRGRPGRVRRPSGGDLLPRDGRRDRPRRTGDPFLRPGAVEPPSRLLQGAARRRRRLTRGDRSPGRPGRPASGRGLGNRRDPPRPGSRSPPRPVGARRLALSAPAAAKDLQWGTAALPEISVAIAEKGFDADWGDEGALGFDVLMRFHAFLDMPRRWAYLRPPGAPAGTP